MPFDLADPAFEKRAPSDSRSNVGAPDPSLPIRLEKNMGLPLYSFGILLFFPLLSTPGLFTQHLSLADLLHTSEPLLLGFELLLILPLYFISQRRTILEISAEGIRLTDRSGKWFYNWADIEGADPVRYGVALRLKGRSDEQNQHNIIPNYLGLTSPQLSDLIVHAISRCPSAAGGPATVAHGDDLQWVQRRTRNVTLLSLGFGIVVVLALVAALVVPNALKIRAFQKHGVATRATVIRLYQADCGKHGCSIYAEYQFAVPGPKGRDLPQTGYGVIGSTSRLGDPNLVSAQTYGVIPVAYDVTDPSISAPNFNNRVFTQDPIGSMLFIFEAVAAGLLAVPLLTFFLLWLSRRISALGSV